MSQRNKARYDRLRAAGWCVVCATPVRGQLSRCPAHMQAQASLTRQRTMGLTHQQYRDLGERQKWCCAICGTPRLELTRDLHADHDHTSGRVRGLLCSRCNVGLGQFSDDPRRLIAATRYLLDHLSPETAGG